MLNSRHQKGNRIRVTRSRDTSKRVLEGVLGEGFNGVIVCDGWRAYPSFTGRIQRCWAYLLREARYLAERNDEAVPLSEALHMLYRRFNVAPLGRPPPWEAERLACEARGLMMGSGGLGSLLF